MFIWSKSLCLALHLGLYNWSKHKRQSTLIIDVKIDRIIDTLEVEFLYNARVSLLASVEIASQYKSVVFDGGISKLLLMKYL